MYVHFKPLCNVKLDIFPSCCGASGAVAIEKILLSLLSVHSIEHFVHSFHLHTAEVGEATVTATFIISYINICDGVSFIICN